MKGDALAALQSAVALILLVVTLGIREGIVHPQQLARHFRDRIQQHRSIPQARQIDVTGKILGELFDLHMIAAPQRYPIQFQSEQGGSEGDIEQAIVLHLAAGAHGQAVLPGQA
jgi:hypothetical protein